MNVLFDKSFSKSVDKLKVTSVKKSSKLIIAHIENARKRKW